MQKCNHLPLLLKCKSRENATAKQFKTVLAWVSDYRKMMHSIYVFIFLNNAGDQGYEPGAESVLACEVG